MGWLFISTLFDDKFCLEMSVDRLVGGGVLYLKIEGLEFILSLGHFKENFLGGGNYESISIIDLHI